MSQCLTRWCLTRRAQPSLSCRIYHPFTGHPLLLHSRPCGSIDHFRFSRTIPVRIVFQSGLNDPAPTQTICNPSVWFLLVLQWGSGQSIIAQLYDPLKTSIKHFISRVLGGLYLDFYDISCRWFMRCFIMCLMSSINNRRTASDLRNILFNLEPTCLERWP